MEAAGLWMLLAVAVVLLATGIAGLCRADGRVGRCSRTIGVPAGGLDYPLLTALPSRIIGLLENDLLQALPLYVFMGALLNRLPLADRLFRCGVALGRRSSGAPALATLGLGALLAPMNGSVGASVAMLSRSVAPKLAARGVPAAESTALVCVASTLGVVIPPSLVLILLGDAMMRAHTEATNVTKEMVRIVNTQDIFRGALVPAAMFLVLCLHRGLVARPPHAGARSGGAAGGGGMGDRRHRRDLRDRPAGRRRRRLLLRRRGGGHGRHGAAALGWLTGGLRGGVFPRRAARHHGGERRAVRPVRRRHHLHPGVPRLRHRPPAR